MAPTRGLFNAFEPIPGTRPGGGLGGSLRRGACPPWHLHVFPFVFDSTEEIKHHSVKGTYTPVSPFGLAFGTTIERDSLLYKEKAWYQCGTNTVPMVPRAVQNGSNLVKYITFDSVVNG